MAETEAGVVREAGAEAETDIGDRGRRGGRGMGGDSYRGRRAWAEGHRQHRRRLGEGTGKAKTATVV